MSVQDESDTTTETTTESGESLASLMHQDAAAAPGNRLDADALAAAEAAVRAGQKALAEAERAIAAGTGHATRRLHGRQKLWLLRAMLALNLVLMVAMLFVPNGAKSPSGAAPPGGHGTADPGTRRAERRAPTLGLPNDKLYEAALLLAMDGRFDQAVTSLEAYAARYPDLDPAVRRLLYGQLSYYLRKAGRIGEALAWENKARVLAGAESLPEDLVHAAAEAEKRGDYREVRRAWASFLLQEKMLSPTLRSLMVEAYLKLGDAYRLEASADPAPTPGENR
jgi:TolA-binding protein